MEKILNKKLLLLFSFTSLLNANFIQAGFGYKTLETNLDALSEPKITSLTSPSHKEDVKDVILQFDFNYKGEKLNYYLRSHETKSALQVGVSKDLNNNLYEIGIEKDLFRETWSNPYTSNVKRESSDYNTLAGYLTYKYSFEKYNFLKFHYRYKEEEVKKDLLKNTLFDRTASIHTLKALYNYYFVYWGVELEDFHANGNANSYFKNGIEIELKYPIDNLFLLTRIGVFKKDFDAQNPIFNKEEKRDEREILFYARYNKPFSQDGVYLATSYTIQNNDSNINFYDESLNTLIFSVGYEF